LPFYPFCSYLIELCNVLELAEVRLRKDPSATQLTKYTS